MKLTEKQKRFVDFYVETGNATEAARRAGYAEKSCRSIAQENLTKPDIKAAVGARLAELESKRIATASEVLQFLTSSMRGEIEEDAIVVEGIGDGQSQARIIRKQLSAHERLDAAKQLAKRFGLDEAASSETASRVEFTFTRDCDES